MSEICLMSGNLRAYRSFILPTAKKLFGYRSFRHHALSKHQQNVQEMLELMALHGAATTWDLSRNFGISGIDSMRSRDKIFRRLLIGRVDRGKSSPGVIDAGLVLVDGAAKSNKYRLSLYGLLYCFSIFDFSDKEVEKIIRNYSHVYPMVFGKWPLINTHFENALNLLKGVADSFTFENNYIAKYSNIPFFEINNYIHTKYVDFYESISEHDFSNQISYWFFTNLPIQSILAKNNVEQVMKDWLELFENDTELRNWYFSFLLEMKNFSLNRLSNLVNEFQLENYRSSILP